MGEQMSDTDDSKDSTFEDLPESEPTPAIAAPRTTPDAARGIAWLALLLAALALAAVAFTIYEDWRTQQSLELNSSDVQASIRAIATRVDASKQDLTELKSQLEVLQRDDGVEKKIDALTRDIEQRLQQLDALPIRTSNLETAMAALQGVSTGARDKWLLGEAEYYMQMANAQLQLASNPELAAHALSLADERIAELANPALTNVRIAIADELAALDGIATSDVEGITLQLASLARVVAGLPIRPVERATDDSAVADPETDQGAIDRAWSSVKQATSDLIKHRTADEEVMPLISPEAEYFLRTNLTLQLQTARLALLRGEQSVYAASLADAALWLETYFDARSEAVRAALRSVNELGGGMPDIKKPDISGSLLLLRQYNSVAESAP